METRVSPRGLQIRFQNRGKNSFLRVLKLWLPVIFCHIICNCFSKIYELHWTASKVGDDPDSTLEENWMRFTIPPNQVHSYFSFILNAVFVSLRKSIFVSYCIDFFPRLPVFLSCLYICLSDCIFAYFSLSLYINYFASKDSLFVIWNAVEDKWLTINRRIYRVDTGYR